MSEQKRDDMMRQALRASRDRTAQNPGGMECRMCGELFIGEEWHHFCAICMQQVFDEWANEQKASAAKAGAAP